MGLDTGIYAITNRANGLRYVGSALLLRKRWKDHQRSLSRGNHHSIYLQRAWDKYGAESFDFAPLLYCDRENLLMYEQRAMDVLKPEYNIAKVAGSQIGYKHTDATREKMRAARKRNGFSPMKGKTHSEESRKKISESRKGKGGQSGWTQERKDRISFALKGRPVPDHVRQKIADTLRGKPSGKATLTAEQVVEVRRLKALGLGKIRIGRAMGIKPEQAQVVILGKSYKWVPL